MLLIRKTATRYGAPEYNLLDAKREGSNLVESSGFVEKKPGTKFHLIFCCCLTRVDRARFFFVVVCADALSTNTIMLLLQQT